MSPLRAESLAAAPAARAIGGALVGLMAELERCAGRRAATGELADLRAAATLLAGRALVRQVLSRVSGGHGADPTAAGLALFREGALNDWLPGLGRWLPAKDAPSDCQEAIAALAHAAAGGPISSPVGPPSSPAEQTSPPAGPPWRIARLLGDGYQAMIAGSLTRGPDGSLRIVLPKNAGSGHGGPADQRRRGGVHYTPEGLVDEQVGPAMGGLYAHAWARADGDLQAYGAALRALRILDPAMGGAHFLVAAAADLALELAWIEVAGAPRPADQHERLTPTAPPNADLARDLAARQAVLLPAVIATCCYGIDVDPLAWVTAEAALWLAAVTACPGADPAAAIRAAEPAPPPPPGNLEGNLLAHLQGHLHCGDALIGLDTAGAAQALVSRLGLPQAVARAALRPGRDGHRAPRWPFDLAVLVELLGVHRSGKGQDGLRDLLAQALPPAHRPAALLPWSALFSGRDAPSKALRKAIVHLARHAPLAAGRPLRPLHPTLAFAPIVDGPRGGFDALLANPPFVGDRDLGRRLGPRLVVWLRRQHTARADRAGGTPDLAGFFTLRYDDLLAPTAAIAATLAPNTLAQGRNRKAVLATLAGPSGPFRIVRADPDRPWPGAASVRICLLHLARPDLEVAPRLVITARHPDGTVRARHMSPTASISTHLDAGPEVAEQQVPQTGAPRPLPSASQPLFYQGMILRGADGKPRDFVHPLEFIEQCPASERGVLRAYLNNAAVQHQPIPTARRVCIDFTDALAQADLSQAPPAEQLAWLRARFPTCLAAIDDVRRTRQALPARVANADHRALWWRFGSPRRGLRQAWRGHDRVLAVGAVGKVWAPVILPRLDAQTGLAVLPMHKLFLAPRATAAMHACLASFLFELHARRQCSTLGAGLNFAPTAAMPTWPWPWPSVWTPQGPSSAGEPGPSGPALAAAIEALEAVRTPLLRERGPELLEHARQVAGLVPRVTWGPTALYALADCSAVRHPAIATLRAAHRDLLAVTLQAYGWTDLVRAMAQSDSGGWTFDRPWIDGTERWVPAQPWRVALRARLLAANEARYWQELALFRDLLKGDGAGTPPATALAATLVDAGVGLPDADVHALIALGGRQRWW